jgi:hypothetical protein
VDEKLGRRGLGFVLNGFEAARVERQVGIVSRVEQQPDWLTPCPAGVPTASEMEHWLTHQVGTG